MRDIMEIAREIESRDPEKAVNEIFELIKKDKQWLGEIVMMYCENVVDDVVMIKNIVYDYQNPITLDEKVEKKEETPE